MESRGDANAIHVAMLYGYDRLRVGFRLRRESACRHLVNRYFDIILLITLAIKGLSEEPSTLSKASGTGFECRPMDETPSEYCVRL